MTQNIYDDETFFEGYARLPRSVAGLDGAAGLAAGAERTAGARSRLWFRVVLPLGAPGRRIAGAGHRCVGEDAGARPGRNAGCGGRLHQGRSGATGTAARVVRPR